MVVRHPDAGVGSALMNVVWFFVAGLWISLIHMVTAFFQAVTIIGIPLAVANLKLIAVTCFPFGKAAVPTVWARAHNVVPLGEFSL